MKLLTLNTHSLQEENYQQKLEWFVESILKEKPDIIALQEVNQTADAMEAEESLKEGQYVISTQVPLKQNNHMAQVAYRLRQAGVACSWVWLPIKLGYGKYDEGVGILVLNKKITNAVAFPISKANDYYNWRTRAVLGIQVEGLKDWFYSIHLGWWNDAEEPFLEQWKRLKEQMQQMEQPSAEVPVWLMGDFNAPDIFCDQSYAQIRLDGWVDMHMAAEEKESDFTVAGIIDGWKDKLPDESIKGLRLDYIWCSQAREAYSSRILFNGMREPVVSDHFGVLVNVKEK